METIDLHCSQLVKWTECEKQRVWTMGQPGGAIREEHVATFIGTAVHAAVAGEEYEEPSHHLVYDSITPTMNHAHRQIARMANEVTAEIKRSGWEVVGHEIDFPGLAFPHLLPQLRLVGRIDILGRFGHDFGILDVKTSRAIEPTWLQMGGYGILYEAAHPRNVITSLCTIHCPRVKLASDQPPARSYYCDASEAMKEAQRVINRISHCLEYEVAVASPSHICGYCDHPSCVVRTISRAPDRRPPMGT